MTRSAFGTISKRGRNVYRIQWTANGRRKGETVHGTRAAAQRRLDEIALGLVVGGERTTFDDYWPRVGMDGLARKTVDEYARLWERELSPRIGCARVSSFDWRSAQEAMDAIDRPSVQRHAFALLRKVCNLAVRDGLMQRNPCDRSIRLKAAERRSKPPFSVDMASCLLGAIRGLKYEPILLCELGGGLRCEEADALTWSDVRAEDVGGTTYAVVDVRRTIVSVAGGSLVQDRTKTEASARSVVIGEPFASRLLSLRSDGPLCPNASGGFTAPATITHNWRSWCARHGVGYVSQKDMRSCYATLCGEAGAPDSLVSMQMGHTDGTTKGRNYQQATLRGGALVADMLAALMGATDF